MAMPDFVFPILTDRLMLRLPTREDMPAWIALHRGLVARGFPVSIPPDCPENAWQQVSSGTRPPGRLLAIELAATGEFIGTCGLFVVSWPTPEVYCWLGERHQRLGLGPETVNGLCSAAFDQGAAYVVGKIDLANGSSIRMALSLGFVPTGMLDDPLGKRPGHLSFSLLPPKGRFEVA